MIKITIFLFLIVSGLLAHGNILTLNFKSMTPHNGQGLYVRVVDTYNNHEVARKSMTVPGAEFMMFFDGIVNGHNYNIDFFADLNGNELYDDPPADHTWRLELDNVQGDTMLTFTHNTNFTALDWQYAVTLEVHSLTPHLNEQFEIRVVDKKTMLEISRDSLSAVESADFNEVLPGIVPGGSYYIDFYADHNGNKIYDVPPADHAWRMELEKPEGDTTLIFTHNTNFTDIKWPYALTLQLSGMTPHLGEAFYIRAIDLLTQMEIGRTEMDVITQSDFEVNVVGAKAAGKYRLEFFADHNGNKLYDDAPTDHTWSMEIETTNGGATAGFQHNTNFTLLNWDYRLFLEMKNMSPHLNQQLEVRVVDPATGKEVGRKKLDAIYDKELTIIIPGIKLNTDYNVDFYADLNGNGYYDSPPVDHAWREAYNAGNDGDGDLSFEHNTNFTDIAWRYNFTLNLINMTPHLGQYFELRLIKKSTLEQVDIKNTEAIPAKDFSISIGGIETGSEYNADFYADLNGNGVYDAPPADHAWRETFTASESDTTITFSHNTNFVDIGSVTTIEDVRAKIAGKFLLFDNYPNPFNPETHISFELPQNAYVRLTIYNINGQKIKTLVEEQLTTGRYNYIWTGINDNGSIVSSGIYFYRLEAENFNEVKHMTLIK